MTKYKNFPPSLEKSPWIATDETGAEYGSKSYRTGEYLHIRVNSMIDVQIKREHEGVVVDLYPLHAVDEPIASTYGMWGDDPNYNEEKEKLPDDFIVTDVFDNIYNTEKFHQKEIINNTLCIKVKNLMVQLEYDLQKKCLLVTIFPDGEEKSISSTKAYLKQFAAL
ncbi:MAG TPA: hypothetical protein PJ987_09570 [Bacteroidia bacterium]|nr:hypothetical protein [Bacteroidia bacterium]HMY42172.1 hypothetical protein [Chitinophagales bacterium]